jgi:acyl-CoA synthetase (AMP-forming)/AMP-acid ligase II
LSNEATEEDLRLHCGDRLARYKVPKAFHFVDELPRNSMGKVQKSELKAKVPA